MQRTQMNVSNRPVSTWSRKAATLVVLATAGLAQSAGAQISGWYSSSTGEFDIDFDSCPDLDQNRSHGFHTDGTYVDGLPLDGDNYCVPSASGNLLAYISLHGFESSETVFPIGYYWGDSDALTYGKATKAIERLGDRMDTIPSLGTSPEGMYEGVRASLPADDFEVTLYAGPRDHVTVPEMARMASEGALIALCYGRYTPEDDKINNSMRVGGHCMTFVGASRVAGETRRLWFQDPGSGGSNEQSQSTFTKEWSVFFDNEWQWKQVGPNIKRDYSEIFRKWTDYTRLIDAACVILPEETTVSFDDPFLVGSARIPNNPDIKATILNSTGTQDDITDERNIDYAGLFDAVRFVDIAYAPSLIDTVAVIEDSNGRHKLILSDYARGEAHEIIGATGCTLFTISRFDDLYAIADGVLNYYESVTRPHHDAFEPDKVMLLPSDVLDIAYDDQTDRVVMLFGGTTGGTPMVRTIDSDLNPNTMSQPTELLGVGEDGQWEIAPSPATGELWVLNRDEGVIVGYNAEALDGGAIAVPFTSRSGFGGSLCNLQVDEQGDLFFRQNDLVRHYVVAESGELLPRIDSPRWGLESEGAFAVTIARSPLIEGIHDQPEWLMYSAEEDPRGRDSGDRGVERGDVNEFVDLFLRREDTADVNHDGVVDRRDVETFFNAGFGG